ncbi:MAG TPA: hypothetical protein VN213_13550 [Solirubrobacteraceae bacterium]|nr:hypothetical protein [Solirubrobacteraceae bacterium]
MATATTTATAATDRYLVTPLGVPLARPYTPHYPHPPQEAFLWLDCLEAFYGGAVGGGKSDALLMAALQYAHVPGYSALLLRRTLPEHELPGGLVHRAHMWLADTDAHWRGDKTTYSFPSGAKLVFGHGETETHIRRYYGSEWQFIGWDELTGFPEAWYRLLFSRLRKPADGPLARVPLRMRAASNPGGPGHDWVKRRFIDRLPAADDPEDTPEKARARIFIPARLPDNPSVDQDAYAAPLAALEPEVRAQLLHGDWDARQPGDWYFDDQHLSAVAERGREFEGMLADGTMPEPAGGVLHLGVDWGESTHAILGWPLEAGGFFVAREFVDYGGEPSEKTLRMLALNEWEWPWGRVFFDAAGVQSQRTFNATADRLLGFRRPAAKSIPFGAQAPRTATGARRSFKGVGCSYLRRLARHTHEGRVQQLAISQHCPVLLRQLKQIKRDPEDPTGAWWKDDDQHGPDALVALVVTAANRFRVGVETTRKVAA